MKELKINTPISYFVVANSGQNQDRPHGRLYEMPLLMSVMRPRVMM